MDLRLSDLFALALVAALLTVAAESRAQSNYYPGTATSPGAYVNPQPFSDYAQVVAVTPVYQQVQVQCGSQPNTRSGNPITDNAGVIIGGVAGGVVGSQFGKGRGNTAATIGGAVIGGAVGNQVQHGQSAPQQCVEQRAVGWQYQADYKGQRLFGQSSRPVNVGDQVRVSVTYNVTLQPM